MPAKPEELLAVQPFARQLVEDYGYPKGHIRTRPQWHVKARPSHRAKTYPVDIAVFSGDQHRDEERTRSLKDLIIRLAKLTGLSPGVEVCVKKGEQGSIAHQLCQAVVGFDEPLVFIKEPALIVTGFLTQEPAPSIMPCVKAINPRGACCGCFHV
ncbi:MAG: hypothetical protein PUK40_05930 [Actinomycetaceae bacterium]|nr:hypothetical protein [Arcanobacterium sp.]MDD7505468.1 hypothetical protein [Actinomycetaceae bacterium]MDY6143154.1 hypothetical protein [Arcanobacterium sp.]